MSNLTTQLISVSSLEYAARLNSGGRWAVTLPSGKALRFRSKSRARRRARQVGGNVRRWRRGMRGPVWPRLTYRVIIDTGSARIVNERARWQALAEQRALTHQAETIISDFEPLRSPVRSQGDLK